MNSIQSALNKLVENRDLASGESEEVMKQIMSGEATPAQMGAFLSALRIKGETPTEIASFARVMQRFASTINPAVEDNLVDTCGTGGDELDTFNVSTTAMFIAAGAGVPIAKHGNRSVTSKSGSADVLESLGVKIDLPPQEVKECIENVGVGFMFAPRFHKSMKHAVGPREEINLRTVFNILGPLTNPAGAKAQVMGVYDGSLNEKLTKVLRKLGSERAMVVYGLDGLDEISNLGETKISELTEDGEIKTYNINPGDFGVPTVSPSDISGGDALENGRIFLKILLGGKGPKRDLALLNAASAILVGGKAKSLKEGFSLAEEAVDSGDAYRKFERFVKETGGNLDKTEELRDSL